MRVRAWHLAFVPLAVSLALPVSAPAAVEPPADGPTATSARTCVLRGARIARRTPTLRILAKGSRYYGCLLSANRIVPFLTRSEERYVEWYGLRLASPYLAFQFDEEATEASYAWIRHIDLRTGARTNVIATQASPFDRPDDPIEPFSMISRVVLARSGALAWTVQAYQYSETDPMPGCRPMNRDWCNYPPEVHKLDAMGPGVIDFGWRVSEGSLKLRRNTISWLHSGELRSYLLLARPGASGSVGIVRPVPTVTAK